MLAPIFAKFDPWIGVRKEWIHVLQFFLEGLSCAPLKFSVEKSCFRPTLLDWSMDFPEIKYMYVNTNRYEDGH